MRTFILTNDETFRKILEEQTEEQLSLLGFRYLTTFQMALTLDDLTEDMAWFLYDNYQEFTADPDADEEHAREQVEVYLHTLEEEEIRELYYQYVSALTVLEDLMDTYRSDRLTILADIRECDESEIDRFDLVWAN
ncbi:MAG: hypothetical protein ACK44B_05920 [Flavobacteriales bacterium]